MINTQYPSSKSFALRGLVNVRQASRLLKIDEFNVYAALWRGSLRGIKSRGRWRISLSEIRRYAERRKTRKGNQ